MRLDFKITFWKNPNGSGALPCVKNQCMERFSDFRAFGLLKFLKENNPEIRTALLGLTGRRETLLREQYYSSGLAPKRRPVFGPPG